MKRKTRMYQGKMQAQTDQGTWKNVGAKTSAKVSANQRKAATRNAAAQDMTDAVNSQTSGPKPQGGPDKPRMRNVRMYKGKVQAQADSGTYKNVGKKTERRVKKNRREELGRSRRSHLG